MNYTNDLYALGSKPISKLLWQYALPAVVAMVAASLYNIIDGIFIGQGVGAEALMGLSVAMPLMILTAAVGMLVGAGSSTLLSIKLGQKDYDTANRILGNVVVANLLCGGITTVLLLVFLDPLLVFFGASAVTLPYAREFMQIILLFNVTSHTYFGLNAQLRSLGKPRQSMLFTIYTVALNALLAPAFIYVLGWGIRGAAFATVLSQIIMLLWQIKLLSNKTQVVYLQPRNFNLDRKIFKESLAIGLSPFLINACGCLVVIVITKSLVYYGGDLAVGAYGISNRMLFLIITIVIGLNQGMQPIAGYNYGAEKIERLLKVLTHTLIAGSSVTCIGFLVFHFFPHLLARAFTPNEALANLSAHALKTMSLAYPIIGMQIVATTFFQCIGYIKQSIFCALTRQLIFLIPLLLILPYQGLGIEGVWLAMPLADTLSCLVTMSMLIYQVRKFKRDFVLKNSKIEN